MHTHSTAMYLIDPICSMDNVVNMWLPTDPDAPIPIQLIDQLLVDSHGVMCQIDAADFDFVLTQIPKLLQGNFQISMGFPTKKKCIEFQLNTIIHTTT